MPLDVWCYTARNITSCRFESIVETVPSDLGKLRRRRWGWWRRHGLRMRATGQKKRQQQRRQRKPFLHIVSSPRRICGLAIAHEDINTWLQKVSRAKHEDGVIGFIGKRLAFLEIFLVGSSPQRWIFSLDDRRVKPLTSIPTVAGQPG